MTAYLTASLMRRRRLPAMRTFLGKTLEERERAADPADIERRKQDFFAMAGDRRTFTRKRR